MKIRLAFRCDICGNEWCTDRLWWDVYPFFCKWRRQHRHLGRRIVLVLTHSTHLHSEVININGRKLDHGSPYRTAALWADQDTKGAHQGDTHSDSYQGQEAIGHCHQCAHQSDGYEHAHVDAM